MGVVALRALTALVATGEWIAWATRSKRLSPQERWWHPALILGFILAFAAHVERRLSAIERERRANPS